MKLYEIISKLENIENSIFYESLRPYLKSLCVYYKDKFYCEPVLMVTDTFNIGSYCRIESSDELEESLEKYLDTCSLDTETRESSKETILFESCMLNTLINE